jgi:hypothetical protein
MSLKVENKSFGNSPIRSRESTTPTLDSTKYFTVVGHLRADADGAVYSGMRRQLSSSVRPNVFKSLQKTHSKTISQIPLTISKPVEHDSDP